MYLYNILRAKIVKDMVGLSRYKWSGHSVIMGQNKAEWQSAGEILEYFGKKKLDAVRKYEEFVAEAMGMPKREDLTGGGLIRSAGGWKEVLNLRRSKEKWLADERILGDEDFVSATLKQSDEEMVRKERLKKEGWEINRLVKTVCELLGVDEKDIKRESRRSKLSQARSLIAYWGNKELGIPGVELAKYFRITESSISEAIVRGRNIANENEYRIA